MVSEKDKTVKEMLITKIDLFSQLLKLTLIQKEESHSGEESIEKIDLIATEKESIRRKIEEIDKKKKISKDVDINDPSEELKPLVSKVKSLIFDILKVEDEILINMEHTKKKIGKELQGLNKGKTIAKGYGISNHLKRGILSIKK